MFMILSIKIEVLFKVNIITNKMDEVDYYLKQYMVSFIFPKYVCLTCTPKESIKKMKLFHYQPKKVYNKCLECVREELRQTKDWCGNS